MRSSFPIFREFQKSVDPNSTHLAVERSYPPNSRILRDVFRARIAGDLSCRSSEGGPRSRSRLYRYRKIVTARERGPSFFEYRKMRSASGAHANLERRAKRRQRRVRARLYLKENSVDAFPEATSKTTRIQEHRAKPHLLAPLVELPQLVPSVGEHLSSTKVSARPST